MFASRWAALGAGLAVGAGLLVSTGHVAAFATPVYGEVAVNAYGGDLVHHGSAASDFDAGAGLLSAHVGSPWWCDMPGCSIAIGPGAGLGWGTVTADPASGLIRTRAGAKNFANEVAWWDIPVPWLPGGWIRYTPAYWGDAATDTYLRSTWKIVAVDPGLAVGAPVEVTATLNLSGTLVTGDKTTIQAALLLNKASDADWLAANESISMHTFVELIALRPDVGSRYYEASAPGAVDHADDLTQTFAVGDVIVMETLLSAFAGAPNLGLQKEVWVNFDQTAHSTLVANTLGVMLVPVPEPGPWALLLAGLGGVGVLARRRGR